MGRRKAMMRFSQLTPVWAGTNLEFMMARPCEFAGSNSDITPQYDDMQPYYKVDIQEDCPHLAAVPPGCTPCPTPIQAGTNTRPGILLDKPQAALDGSKGEFGPARMGVGESHRCLG